MALSSQLPVEIQHSVLTSLEIANTALEVAIGQKARDVRGLHLTDLTDIAEYFVIVSGHSDRHVKGIADRIKDELRRKNETPVTVVGYENAEWILLDYGNVIVHVFHEPMRHFYNLDGLWSGGDVLTLSSELEEQAKKLRTGMY